MNIVIILEPMVSTSFVIVIKLLIMPRGVFLSSDLKERIVNLYSSGEKQSEISSRFQVSKQTVSKIIKRHKDRGHVESLTRGGRPRKTSIRTDKLIKRTSQKYPTMSGCQILNEFTDVNVSTRTILRRLED